MTGPATRIPGIQAYDAGTIAVRKLTMATRRNGLPYIHVGWLAKALGNAPHACLYSPWFKAHHFYDKYEEQASDLVLWNREHHALMRAVRQELEAAGWACTVEEQNEFKLKGRRALVAGKPDLVATKPGRVLVVDGKTGRERDSDIHQVLIYLYAIPKSRPDLADAELEGEVRYQTGEAFTFTAAELTQERLQAMVDLIGVIAGDTPPTKQPSIENCRFCNIGPSDCPQRMRAVAVGDF